MAAGALLRIVVLIANAVFFAWAAYIIHNARTGPTPQGQEFWLAYGILICLALNFMYLLMPARPYLLMPDRPLKGRIFRLIALWFDAKESELRHRINLSQGE
jgi:hypothetical protein